MIEQKKTGKYGRNAWIEWKTVEFPKYHTDIRNQEREVWEVLGKDGVREAGTGRKA